MTLEKGLKRRIIKSFKEQFIWSFDSFGLCFEHHVQVKLFLFLFQMNFLFLFVNAKSKKKMKRKKRKSLFNRVVGGLPKINSNFPSLWWKKKKKNEESNCINQNHYFALYSIISRVGPDIQGAQSKKNNSMKIRPASSFHPKHL